MNTVQHKNPWLVESIQDFSCLKCPECVFFTKEENDFENHAVANHPLSSELFDETMSSSEIKSADEEEVPGDVNDVKVHNLKKEPAYLDTSERDPFDFSNTNIRQHGTHFMSALVGHDSSDNDYSFHPRNKAKKLKIEPSTNIRQHGTHVESVHYKKDGKIHACSLCDFQENDTSKFNNHLKIHKHYQCVDCENKFHGANSKTIFNMHLEHLEKTESQKPCDGKYIMHCDLCSSRFEDENVFKSHVSSEHEVMPEIYYCSLCNYQTQSFAYWNKHVKTVYECDNCGDTFHGHNARRNLKFHLKTHQEKTPKPQKIKPRKPRKLKPKISHECSHCEKSFPYLSYLNRHKKNIHALNIERKIDLQLEKESSPLPEKHLM